MDNKRGGGYQENAALHLVATQKMHVIRNIWLCSLRVARFNRVPPSFLSSSGSEYCLNL